MPKGDFGPVREAERAIYRLLENLLKSHFLIPVDDLKGPVSHRDQQLICTDLKKI